MLAHGQIADGDRGDSGARYALGSNPFTAPSISLPKGGGAIRGIGEKFAANPATGTGSVTVPIAVSPGRSGFGPQLTLTYDSGAGNGPFGFGWSLGLPAIIRKTDRGLPLYCDDDVFILMARKTPSRSYAAMSTAAGSAARAPAEIGTERFGLKPDP